MSFFSSLKYAFRHPVRFVTRGKPKRVVAVTMAGVVLAHGAPYGFPADNPLMIQTGIHQTVMGETEHRQKPEKFSTKDIKEHPNGAFFKEGTEVKIKTINHVIEKSVESIFSGGYDNKEGISEPVKFMEELYKQLITTFNTILAEAYQIFLQDAEKEGVKFNNEHEKMEAFYKSIDLDSLVFIIDIFTTSNFFNLHPQNAGVGYDLGNIELAKKRGVELYNKEIKEVFIRLGKNNFGIKINQFNHKFIELLKSKLRFETPNYEAKEILESENVINAIGLINQFIETWNANAKHTFARLKKITPEMIKKRDKEVQTTLALIKKVDSNLYEQIKNVAQKDLQGKITIKIEMKINEKFSVIFFYDTSPQPGLPSHGPELPIPEEKFTGRPPKEPGMKSQEWAQDKFGRPRGEPHTQDRFQATERKSGWFNNFRGERRGRGRHG